MTSGSRNKNRVIAVAFGETYACIVSTVTYKLLCIAYPLAAVPGRIICVLDLISGIRGPHRNRPLQGTHKLSSPLSLCAPFMVCSSSEEMGPAEDGNIRGMEKSMFFTNDST